ncbi:MAG: hypothetical protein ACJA2Z_000357 [Candidatus Paceibacteria bacterium]|jgi:hypothetical protein
MKTVAEKYEVWTKDLEIIEALRADHFIHVTGLTSKMHGHDPSTIESPLQQFDFSKKGAIDSNNNMTAVITPHGFYFLKRGQVNLDESIREMLSFNDGNGVGVYCSNGDKIYSEALLERVSDPLNENHGDPFYGVR